MQKAECRIVSKECSEQIKTVDNRFYRSECAETRSSASRVYRGERCDYVSRVDAELNQRNNKNGKRNCRKKL
jgi:hypothetical protein